METRIEKKLEAVAAFARANPLDRCLYNLKQARMGIVTTGKAHLDLMAALDMLGLSEEKLRALGIDIYKVGLVWPLEKHGAMDFIRGKEEVLVIEEKRGIIESQIKEHLSAPDETIKVRIIGKHDEQGRPLVPYVGELGPNMLAKVVADRKERSYLDEPQQEFNPVTIAEDQVTPEKELGHGFCFVTSP